MPQLEWNRSFWNDQYNWNSAGQEWSDAWGGSEAQWYGSLLPRVHRLLPAPTVLELAPGFGRWTRFLLPMCESYFGIDISLKCVEACQSTFAEARHAQFIVNDGLSLGAVEDGSIDFVFSFDSFVHVEIDVLGQYIPQVIQKLKPGGVAFIHHSNLAAYGNAMGEQHARAASVSRENVEQIINASGGKVIIQEIINWVNSGTHDCLSTFCRTDSPRSPQKPVHLLNPKFMIEADVIKSFQAKYCAV